MRNSVQVVPLRFVIVEELSTAFTASRGYVEVFKNPTPKEYQIAMEPMPDDDDASLDLTSWRNMTFDGERREVLEVRGIITAKDLFIWNYEKSLHGVAMREVGKDLKIPLSEMIPVYLDVNLKTKTLAVRFGSGYGLPAGTKALSATALLKLAKTHPAFRGWNLVKGQS